MSTDPILTKAYHPEDHRVLPAQADVCAYMATQPEGCLSVRAWGYGMALYARAVWQQRMESQRPPGYLWQILDVGGVHPNGRDLPLTTILSEAARRAGVHQEVAIVDPVLTATMEAAHISANSQDCIFGLDLFEHAAEPTRVLKAMHRALVPWGLLFLTFAYTDSEGPDEFCDAYTRRRIYTPHTWNKLYKLARELGFRKCGEADWKPRGSHRDDYNTASLCMVKLPATGDPGDRR